MQEGSAKGGLISLPGMNCFSSKLSSMQYFKFSVITVHSISLLSYLQVSINFLRNIIQLWFTSSREKTGSMKYHFCYRSKVSFSPCLWQRQLLPGVIWSPGGFCIISHHLVRKMSKLESPNTSRIPGSSLTWRSFQPEQAWGSVLGG